MRKFLLTSVMFLLLSGTILGAQYPVDKGSTIISGGFSFTNSSGELYEDEEGHSTTTLTLAPSVLTFVVPNFAVGGHLQLTRVSQGDANATGLAIGPKLGYFVGGPNSKAYPYFGMGFGYLRSTFEVGSGYERGEYTISGTKFFFSAGVAIMVAPHLAIACEGTYNIDNLKPEHGESASGNTFAIVISLGGFIF
jgi:hypothetical protein